MPRYAYRLAVTVFVGKSDGTNGMVSAWLRWASQTAHLQMLRAVRSRHKVAFASSGLSVPINLCVWQVQRVARSQRAKL